MLSPLPLVVSLAASLVFLQSTTISALPTSEAPTCAIKCFQKKVEEGDYLAPGAKGLHGLCKTPNWVKAYNNCLDDNCKEEYIESAYLFGVNVCTGKITTSAAHGDSSSARKLSKCNDDQCSASSTSASATLTDSDHPASCTCTETSHGPGATQVYVGSAPSSTVSANVTSSAESSPSVATASVASPTATSGAAHLSIGFGAAIAAVIAATLS